MKSVSMQELDEFQLEDLYEWVDQIPLSRKKRNLARDFSDAVLMAEVIHHFRPKLVDVRSYDQGLRVDTKIYNWKTLNGKVLKRLGMPLDTATISDLANAVPGAIESVLWQFKEIIEDKKEEKKGQGYFDDARMDMQQVQNDRKLLIEKIRESEEQVEYIAALEAKIEKLEELMRLKDAKIAKLTARNRK